MFWANHSCMRWITISCICVCVQFQEQFRKHNQLNRLSNLLESWISCPLMSKTPKISHFNYAKNGLYSTFLCDNLVKNRYIHIFILSSLGNKYTLGCKESVLSHFLSCKLWPVHTVYPAAVYCIVLRPRLVHVCKRRSWFLHNASFCFGWFCLVLEQLALHLLGPVENAPIEKGCKDVGSSSTSFSSPNFVSFLWVNHPTHLITKMFLDIAMENIECLNYIKCYI